MLVVIPAVRPPVTRTDRGERVGLTTDERAELVRLRRENAQVAMASGPGRRALISSIERATGGKSGPSALILAGASHATI